MSEESRGLSSTVKFPIVAGPSQSRLDVFEDEEVFNNSSFLAKFDTTAVQKSHGFENNLNDSIDKNGLNVR